MLKIINYSDKSIALIGEGSKPYKDRLKELGGKYNPNLTDGAGWIFSKNATDKVESFLKEIGNSAKIGSESSSEEVVESPKGNVESLQKFCGSLSRENVKESRKIFTELHPVAQKLFLDWAWEILSHKSKYPDGTYMVAYKIFRLFRGKEASSIPSYEKYSKMPMVNKLYTYASQWKDQYKDSDDSNSKSIPRSSRASRASRSSRSSPTPRASRSSSSRASKSKKYDKEYQRYDEPETEIDPLYIYYTTLFKERPKSKLAIVWLTEHGIFEGDERDDLVESYKKIKSQ
jgi:hypothetical protein